MMTNLLGIDYGRAKIGISVATSTLAEPFMVIKSSEFNSKIFQIIKKFKIQKIIVGVSEGAMAEESKKFGHDLATKTGLPVEFSDETLSSHDAQALSIMAGKKRKKRRRMEDAYAAAIMLQQFIDNRQ